MSVKWVGKWIQRIIAGVSAAVAILVGTAIAASAVELISIPIDGIVVGVEGDVILVATAEVPVEFVGQTCEIVGETDNQESIHDSNDLLIVNGGQTLVVPNFEDEGFIIHQAGEFDEMSPKIDVFVRLGPDGVSSGGFRVIVDCDKTPPTTGPVTTTVPSTTAPPTTQAPVTETSTTEPEVDPQGPITAVEPKTDIAMTPSSTTTAPPPAGPAVSSTDTLPVTGSTTAWFLAVGAGMVAAGLLTRKVAGVRR